MVSTVGKTAIAAAALGVIVIIVRSLMSKQSTAADATLAFNSALEQAFSDAQTQKSELLPAVTPETVPSTAIIVPPVSFVNPAPLEIKSDSLVKANAAAATAISAQLAFSLTVGPRLTKLVDKKIAAQLQKVMAKKQFKVAAAALEKIGAKLGPKLAKLGIGAGSKVGKALAKAGTKVGSMGPVGVAMLVFDAVSISLDLADVGGYSSAGSNEIYLKMKQAIDKEVKAAYLDAAVPYPSVVGPMDKLADDVVAQKISDRIAAIMADPSSAFMKPVLAAVALANPPEDRMDAVIQAELDKVDLDAVYDVAYGAECVAQGGKLVGKQCTYATKAACDKSYKWPIADDGGDDVYAEWQTMADGTQACGSASYGLRGVCESNGVAYDTGTGQCVVDASYCLGKGLKWRANPKIGNKMDCSLPMGQKVAELIFGTTIVRGLQQVFGADQYSKCAAGEVDDGYFCRKMTCPTDKPDESNALCYKSCPPGQAGNGPLCWDTCASFETAAAKDAGKWSSDGATCRRAGFCPAGSERQGALCYPSCDPGWQGRLTRCVMACPPGFKDDGVSGCIKPASYGRGAGYALWREGACKKDNPQGCEKNGALWYPKCKAGYHNVGCCTCSPDCPASYKDYGVGCSPPVKSRGVGVPDTIIKSKKSYARGVGVVPQTKIQAKHRIVPYSK